MGAIALIFIMEGRHEATKNDYGYTDRMLEKFRIFALARGQIDARTFHSFLQVNEDFEKWIERLKEKHGMKYKSDYIRLSFGKRGKPKVYSKDTGEGDIIFGLSYSTKVAKDESTPRGKMVREFIEGCDFCTLQGFRGGCS